MKILNKFIWSKTEPQNKNDVWFDGSVFKLFKGEEWEAFTLPVDTAKRIAEILNNAFDIYQEKLIAGKGIKIENNTISTTSIFKLVNRLPDIGEEGIIYLVSFESSNGTDNQLVEYIWRDVYWEKLGEFKTDVDLSAYVKASELKTINGQSLIGEGNIEIDLDEYATKTYVGDTVKYFKPSSLGNVFTDKSVENLNIPADFTHMHYAQKLYNVPKIGYKSTLGKNPYRITVTRNSAHLVTVVADNESEFKKQGGLTFGNLQYINEAIIPDTIARKSELTELSAEVSKKVDADFVNNAIAAAIGETIDGGY